MINYWDINHSANCSKWDDDNIVFQLYYMVQFFLFVRMHFLFNRWRSHCGISYHCEALNVTKGDKKGAANIPPPTFPTTKELGGSRVHHDEV